MSHNHIPDGHDAAGIKGAKVVDLAKRDPIDILGDFVMRVTGFKATDEEKEVLRTVLEKTEEGGAK